jgi:hypothetical protein
MGEGLKRVREENHKIYLAISNLGSDLLIPAQWPALEFGDFEAKFPFQNRAGGAGGVYFMVGQKSAVEFSPLHQIPFLMVMGNESDLFIVFHPRFFCESYTAFKSLLCRIGRFEKRREGLS